MGAEGGDGLSGKAWACSAWWPGSSKATVCYGPRFTVIAGDSAVAKYWALVTFA